MSFYRLEAVLKHKLDEKSFDSVVDAFVGDDI